MKRQKVGILGSQIIIQPNRRYAKKTKTANKVELEDKAKPVGLLSYFEGWEALQYYCHYKTHSYLQYFLTKPVEFDFLLVFP